jgi:uncharacterized phage-associated protein
MLPSCGDERKDKKMSSAIHAANNFIIRANKCAVKMSHLKLQKLLYILYARLLAKTDVSLFANRFEAWEHGPVITDLYNVFSKYGKEPIKEPHPDATGEIRFFVLSGAFGKCFEAVWDKYAWRLGRDLVAKVCEKDSAWDKTVKRDSGALGGFLLDEDIKKDRKSLF